MLNEKIELQRRKIFEQRWKIYKLQNDIKRLKQAEVIPEKSSENDKKEKKKIANK